MAEPNPADVRVQIANAVDMLAAARSADVRTLKGAARIAIDALRAAAAALDERDEQLGLVTDPELDAAKEVAAARREVAAIRGKLVDLEVKLAASEADRQLEHDQRVEDGAKLQKLAKRVERLDEVLLDDDDAFTRYMDKSLDRKPPPKR